MNIEPDNGAEYGNKRTMLALLQKEVLGVQNPALLTELHYDEECRLMNPNSYSQMQKENDPIPKKVDQNDEDSVNGSTPASGEMSIYNGAFAFTSPPARLM